MARPFVTLDVFTTEPLKGNPLAVVLDGSGFDDEHMQSIAREFNLSETVFVLPPEDPAHRAALRIFTPARELPFAGHPTIGTAVLLAILDHAESGFVLEERVGPVACRASVTGEGAGQAIFRLPRLPARVGASGNDEAIARALGVLTSDIGVGIGAARLAPAVYSAGVPYHIVPMATRMAVDRVEPVATEWAQAFGEGPQGVYAVAFDPVDNSHHLYARMRDVGFGIGEDPATGSAAAALAGALFDALNPPDGSHRFVIEQGYRMGRPSQIGLTLHVEGGALVSVDIDGSAVIMSRGTITL